jgi:type IV pilus assembly protein PilY1
LLNEIAVAGGTSSALPAKDPETLSKALNDIFLDILNRTSSATGAAVVSENSTGTGAIYQALFTPKEEDILGNKVTWVGSLSALFIDEFGYLREDKNQNSQLDNYTTDPIIQIFFDDTNNESRANRISSDSTDLKFPENFSPNFPADISDKKPI